MVQLIQAGNLARYAVEAKFSLHRVNLPEFFLAWQTSLLSVTEIEKPGLDQVKADGLALERYPLHEEIVALLIKGMNFIAAISSHPHINGGLAEPSLQDLPPG